MADKPDKAGSRKFGLLLIAGGLLIVAITLSGYYASRNPGMVAGLLSGQQSSVNTDILETTLTAPPDCSGISGDMFKTVCGRKDITPLPVWSGNLDEPDRNCLYASFRNTTLYMMQYRREPVENFKDYDTDAGVILHACDLAEALPGAGSNDAGALLNVWYKKRRAEMKAVQ